MLVFQMSVVARHRCVAVISSRDRPGKLVAYDGAVQLPPYFVTTLLISFPIETAEREDNANCELKMILRMSLGRLAIQIVSI